MPGQPTPVRVNSGGDAIVKFLKTFLAAPNDADIEIRIGTPFFGGSPHVIVSLGGCLTAMLPEDADKLACIMEGGMRELGRRPEAMVFANIIMGLCQGAIVAKQSQ